MDQATLDKTVAASIFANCDLVIGMTLVAYDFLMMLPKEMKYVWNADWSAGKLLFVAVRYMPFIDLSILPFGYTAFNQNMPLPCSFAAYWQVTTACIAILLADVVYDLRTWGLWYRNRYLGWFILSSWLALNVSAVFVLAILQPALPSQRIPGLSGCFMLPTSSNEVWIAYLLTTSFQIVLFLATVGKGVQHWRHRSESNLTSVLYRDAFLSFLAQVCVGMANVVLLATMRDINYSLDVTYRALLAILPSRIILNMREAVRATSSLPGWHITMDRELTMAAEELSVPNARGSTAVVEDEPLKVQGGPYSEGLPSQA